MNNKIISLLGIASKAGRLSFGMDASKDALNTTKAELLVIACDISEKSKKEIGFFAEKYSVRQIVLNGLNIKTVSDAVGRKCGILTINDSGFANAIIKAYVEGGNADDE